MFNNLFAFGSNIEEEIESVEEVKVLEGLHFQIRITEEGLYDWDGVGEFEGLTSPCLFHSYESAVDSAKMALALEIA